jgi:hypothetical protein
MVTRQLAEIEGMRAGELTKLKGGATYRALQKGYAEAGSPVTAAPPMSLSDALTSGSGVGGSSAGTIPLDEAMQGGGGANYASGGIPLDEAMGQGSTWRPTPTPPAPQKSLGSLEQYYSGLYGSSTAGSNQPTTEQAAQQRAKLAGAGSASGSGAPIGGATTGPSGESTGSPWIPASKEQNPWI